VLENNRTSLDHFDHSLVVLLAVDDLVTEGAKQHTLIKLLLYPLMTVLVRITDVEFLVPGYMMKGICVEWAIRSAAVPALASLVDKGSAPDFNAAYLHVTCPTLRVVAVSSFLSILAAQFARARFAFILSPVEWQVVSRQIETPKPVANVRLACTKPIGDLPL
jgi:hypothetical protein